MKRASKLSRKLADLSFLLIEIIRYEFKADSSTGLTMAQFKMLYMIREGTRNVGKLAEYFGISQPAASKMTDTLVREGFLKRVPSARDRRQVELHLTRLAVSTIETMFAKALAGIDRRLSAISPSRANAISNMIIEVSKLLAPGDK